MSRRSYRQTFENGWPGLLSEYAGSASPTVRAYKVLAGASAEIWTITTPASPTSSAEYKFTLDQGVARFTTDASATQAELVTGLETAIKTNPIISGRVTTLVSGTTIILTSRQYGFAHTVSASGTGLTVAKTNGTGVMPAAIPFGRFAARPANSLVVGQCQLPALTTDLLLGIALSVRDVERTYVGSIGSTPGAVNPDAYVAGTVADIVARTEGGGVWVETVDEAISINDLIRVSLLVGQEGKVTKSTTDASTIPLAGFSTILQPQVTLSDGRKIILISYNKN
jgi:hypothetical protein